MQQRHRHHPHAADRERAVDLRNAICGMPPPFAAGGSKMYKTSAAIRAQWLRREQRNRAALQHVEAPHFVQAHHVIGVAVREQDRVDAAHVVVSACSRRSVDGIDEYRRPAPTST